MKKQADNRVEFRQRLSRRRALGRTATAGAGLAIIAGCAKQQPVSQPATEEPKRGVLRHKAGFETTGVGLDPHVLAHIFSDVYTLFYQRLLAYKANIYEVEPELAQKWEQPSPTEFLFTLQPGVKWHNKPPANGRLLTADDVVFSLERIRTNDPRFFSRTYLDLVDRIEAVDTGHVRLSLKEPDAALLSKLSLDGMAILAPEVVERAAGRFATPDTAVGTGPFIITSLEQGVGAEFVRNPDYWKPGLPYLDGVRTLHFLDDQTAWAAFVAGQLDAVPTVPGTEIKKYIDQQGPNYTPEWYRSIAMLGMYANTRVKPMDDPRVTRALKLLVDHEEHIKAVQEPHNGRGANGLLFPTSVASWDLPHEEYYKYLEWKQPKDEAVKVALDLLRAAGFSRDHPLKFEFTVLTTSPANQATGELVQAQWRRFSGGIVEAEIKPSDLPTQNRIRPQRQFTYLYGGETPGPDPGMALDLQYRTGGSRNFSGFSDPHADALINKQRALYNVNERKAVIREIILYMMDHYPGTVPALNYKISAAKPYVKGGFAPQQNLFGKQYERLWLDKA